MDCRHQLAALEDGFHSNLTIANAPLPKAPIGAKYTMILTMAKSANHKSTSGWAGSDCHQGHRKQHGDERICSV
jgi:hypothetical protein